MTERDELAWYEEFFLDRLRKGLELQGEALSAEDEAWLRSPASADPEEVARTRRLATALRLALDWHIQRYPEEKRVSKHIGVPVPPPVARWHQAHRALREGSPRTIRRVVEEWRRRFFRRQWLRGLMRGGWIP